MGLYAPEPATLYANRGASAAAVVAAHEAIVFAVSCANANAGARWIQLRNSKAAPSPGDAVGADGVEFPVPALGTTIIGADFFTAGGVRFPTGVTVAFSTTSGTYTAGAAGDQQTQVVTS